MVPVVVLIEEQEKPKKVTAVRIRRVMAVKTLEGEVLRLKEANTEVVLRDDYMPFGVQDMWGDM